MAKVNYYLKDPKSKGETLIYLFFNFNNNKLKYSTGENVSPKHWNKDTQRVRRSFVGSEGLNKYLDFLETETERIYRHSVANSILATPDYLRAELLKVSQKETPIEKGFFDILSEYISIKDKTISKSYLKKVNTLRNSLAEFQRDTKYKVSFESIDLKFYDKFKNFLMNDRKKTVKGKTVVYSGMLNNSVGSNFSVLKTFLQWATSRGYNSNMTYKNKEFKVIKEENDIIYLTENELFQLFNLDLSQNKRLHEIRETFCFSCFTGLRYSDISKVKKQNIKDDHLNIVTEKTTDKLSIPLNEFALEILERNDYELKVISNQKSNDNLKVLGRLAKIDEPTQITKFRGRERIETPLSPKYEFLSTHTGRRTFCTLSLEKGMRAETVRAITGHKDMRSFMRYIKITDKIKRIEMNEVWRRTPSETLRAI